MAAGSLLSLRFRYGATDTGNCDVTSNDNNGNIREQQISPLVAAQPAFSQVYQYDAVNRLLSVTEGLTNWSRVYIYDSYGNRALTGSGAGSAVGIQQPQALAAFDAATNRLSAAWADYDNAGNLDHFKFPGNAAFDWTAAYDAENKQRWFCKDDSALCTQANADAEYRYDGQGQRVQKILNPAGPNPATTTYVYDAGGRLAAEYSTQGPATAAGRYFRTTDHLGSTRLVTDGQGLCKTWQDFYPFGERILGDASTGRQGWTCYGGGGTDPFKQEFTAKERDAESNLDYFLARYYGSSLGRFNSVDPGNAGADPSNPQSWNAYAYVNNNPLIFVDPDGLALTIVTFEGEDLTDEQRKFIDENREQIQQTIADRFKEAGVEDVFFLSASDLTDEQRAALTQRETTGIGLLNFVDTSIANFDASGRPSLKGGTSAQGTSAVFLGNLGGENGLAVGAELAFGVGEVSSHELGHQFGFPATGATTAFIKRMFGGGNLMDEGQGNPRPGSPQFFDASDKVIQRVVREINTRGSSISRRRRR